MEERGRHRTEHGGPRVQSGGRRGEARRLRQRRRRIAVVEGSKIGATTFARVCPVENLDMIITDTSAPEDKIQEFCEAGIEVVVV